MTPLHSQDLTIYSTESGRHCPKCGKPISQCICKKAARPAGDGVVRVALETKGRKGKTVTLVSGIALNDEAIHDLLSSLKRLCGAGGAFKEGVIEIQGDHRDTVFEGLKKRGFTVKKVGG
jgi:translation initiation factor 1